MSRPGAIPSALREKLLLFGKGGHASIFHRVYAAMVSVTLALLLIVGALSFGFMRHLVRENVRKSLAADAGYAQVRLEQTMNGIAESLANLSSNLVISNAIVDTVGREAYIIPFMKSFRLQNDVSVRLTLCDYLGKPIASNVRSPRAFTAPGLLAATIGEGRGYAELVQSGTGQSLLLAFPVVWVMTHQPEGILVGEIDLGELFTKTVPFSGVGEDRNVSLLAGERMVLEEKHLPGASFSQLHQPLKLRPPLDALAFQLEMKDYREVKAGWLVAIYAGAGLLFLLVARWVSKVLALRLTGRLVALSQGVRRISESGSLDIPLEISGADEVAALAASFKEMIAKVREARDTLEQKVRERTEELRGLNEKLEAELNAHRRTEADLRRANETLRSFVRYSPLAIVCTDLKTNVTTWNPAAEKFFGWREAEVIGRRNPIVPAAMQAEYDALRRAVQEGTPYQSRELVRQRKDGTPIHLSASSSSLYDNDGTIIGLLGIFEDITERKRDEKRLQESEQFTRTILDTVDEGFMVLDRQFRILTANKAYCAQTGVAPEAIIGRRCYESSHRRARPCYEEGEECAVRHVFETGEPHASLHTHPDPKGGLLYVETKAFPIVDGTGAVVSVIETINNITEKHLLEEEQLKTQKLEAIGTLAGGIAHDFNNLLQGVFGYISLTKISLGQRERSLSMLEQAEKALHMAVNLTHQLLTFSKGGKPIKRKVGLRSVVENSVRFALSGSSVEYTIATAEDLWPVEADEGQIGQVIQNIVLNADQSMPLGGQVGIAAQNVTVPGTGVPHLLAAGKYVAISVQDSGAGISPPHLKRIFDPYFTTKDKGSGLGLATAYSIVNNHGGLIDVASELGRGSTFTVYLPAVEARVEAAAPPEHFPASRRGTILLMDDDDIVRGIAGAMLDALGHVVEFASHGEAAIEKYRAARESGAPFDLVILDLTIRGGLGGKETVARLRAIDPGVMAVVSSGYSDDSVVSEYGKYGFQARLNKPYLLEDLRQTLSALLG